MDEVKNPSKASIEFFKRVKKAYPTTATGAIDSTKVDYHMLEASDDPEIISYLFKKLPEFLLRGWNIMAPYYAICSQKTEKGKKPYDEIALKKIAQGDLSDVKSFEEFYPSLQILSRILRGKLGQAGYYLDTILWEEEEILPEDVKRDLPKYHDVYEQMIHSDGMYRYKGVLYESRGIEMLLESETENLDEIRFAYKIATLHRLRRGEDIFNSRRLENTEERNKNEEKFQEGRKARLEEDKKKLGEVEAKLKKYNFLTSIFKRKEKKKDQEEKENLVKRISNTEKTIAEIDEHIARTNEEIDFIKKYEEKYKEAITKHLIPILLETFGKTIPKEQLEKIKEIIEICFSKASLDVIKGDPLSLISQQLDEIGEEPFNEYFARFNNALMTMGGIADSFIAFEEQENKTLSSTLNIIRGELKGVPADSDHKPIEEGYRKFDLDTDLGLNDFMSATPHPEQIEPLMNGLSKDFDDLMQEENLDEYIKKVGKLWYKLLLVHPFTDGNGRTGRYLLNILLAHKGIIIPALFNSKNEQTIFQDRLDKFVLQQLRSDYDGLGDEFLDIIREIGIDITGEDRLRVKPQVVLEEQEEEEQKEEHSGGIRR